MRSPTMRSMRRPTRFPACSRRGRRPEVLVGLCMDRSASMVAALLAVLKSGGAYVPLDPSFPDQRLAYMLRDSGARLLLTEPCASGPFRHPLGPRDLHQRCRMERRGHTAGTPFPGALGSESGLRDLYVRINRKTQRSRGDARGTYQPAAILPGIVRLHLERLAPGSHDHLFRHCGP